MRVHGFFLTSDTENIRFFIPVLICALEFIKFIKSIPRYFEKFNGEGIVHVYHLEYSIEKITCTWVSRVLKIGKSSDNFDGKNGG